MTIKEVNEIFRQEYPNFKNAVKQDYLKVQEAYAAFTDALCKDGQITNAQWDRACCPKR